MNDLHRTLLASVTLLLICAACSADAEPEGVHSILSGRITVSAEVDSVADYRGFEVLVFSQTEEGLDTLGHARTDSSGAFRMDVTAPERGVYPLAISRRGAVLKVADIVVAEDDTASFTATFPDAANRLLIIRSRENGGLLAFQNARAQHNQTMYRLLQSGEIDTTAIDRTIGQTVNMLWGIQDNYGGTMGAQLAAAESVLMLEGIDDSLLVARARTLTPENPSFVEAAQAARRAQTRLEGPEAGIQLLEELAGNVPDEHTAVRVGLEAERIVALMQSGRREEALAAAQAMAEEHPESTGADWATRIAYDLEHLMPGMEAPHFSLTTLEGETVMVDSLEGRYVLLEFYNPLDPVYQRELQARNALYEVAHERGLEIVSVSVVADSTVNEAFYETRDLPGVRAIAAGGPNSSIVQTYNVSGLPKRILINREGEIVSSYTGAYMPVLMDEVATLLANEQQPG